MTPSYSELPSLAAYYSKMLYIYFFSLYSDLSFSLPFLSFSFFMISHSLYFFSLFLCLSVSLFLTSSFELTLVTGVTGLWWFNAPSVSLLSYPLLHVSIPPLITDSPTKRFSFFSAPNQHRCGDWHVGPTLRLTPFENFSSNSVLVQCWVWVFYCVLIITVG